MIDADKCFLCGKKLRLGFPAAFYFWRSPFHFACAVVYKDERLVSIFVPLCGDDFKSIRTNKEVVTAMIESKLWAKGDL
jgi:hypothetical protein